MPAFLVIVVASLLATAVSLFSSTYVIDEGRVGVITYMGKAERQERPNGLQFKTPFVAQVREFDVRERSLPIQISGATSNQLPTTMDVSFNWRPDPDQILDIFVKYGGPQEFAANTIRSRLSQSAKAVVGEFSSVDLTQKRNEVADAMLQNAIATLDGYPVILSSVQIDNFTLPDRYWKAVLDREEQRELTEKEKLALEQQNLVAKQAVQTAEADRDAERARADGEAYATRVTAEAQADALRLRAAAEAEGIEKIQEALAGNPLLIEYERVKSWNGQLPDTVLGDSPNMMMNLN